MVWGSQVKRRRVALLDCELRRGKMVDHLKLSSSLGLSEEGNVILDDAGLNTNGVSMDREGGSFVMSFRGNSNDGGKRLVMPSRIMLFTFESLSRQQVSLKNISNVPTHRLMYDPPDEINLDVESLICGHD